MTQTSNYALRLQTSLLNALKSMSSKEGASINQLINVAVAEKLSAIGAETYLAARKQRANVQKGFAVLQKAGKNNKPLKEDRI